VDGSLKSITTAATILIVDDGPDWLDTCRDILSDHDFNVLTATSGKDVIKIIRDNFVDVIITDLVMPEIGGLEIIEKIMALKEGHSCILMTSFPSIESAIPALKSGAADYLIKPFTPEQLLHSVRSVLKKDRLARDNRFLRAEMERIGHYGELIGKSDVMRELYRQLESAKGIDSSMLILGESGTGKELVARILHRNSIRSANSFVPINCAAIPADLLESELFGHEVGAFSGAVKAREGLFEAGEGGTIFLDEIGEMPLALQSKLLRVLEDKKIRRVGANREKAINVRIISATNRNLLEMVKEGKFREDLYYRLNVISMAIPPLRERREDIILLLQHYFSVFASKDRIAPSKISTQVRDALLKYAWPGNVRELSNLAQFLLYARCGESVEVEHLPKQLQAIVEQANEESFVQERSSSQLLVNDFSALYDLPLAEAKQKLADHFEKNYIKNLLIKYDWNVSQAAEKSRFDRRSLHRIIHRHNLKRPE